MSTNNFTFYNHNLDSQSQKRKQASATTYNESKDLSILAFANIYYIYFNSFDISHNGVFTIVNLFCILLNWYFMRIHRNVWLFFESQIMIIKNNFISPSTFNLPFEISTFAITIWIANPRRINKHQRPLTIIETTNLTMIIILILIHCH